MHALADVLEDGSMVHLERYTEGHAGRDHARWPLGSAQGWPWEAPRASPGRELPVQDPPVPARFQAPFLQSIGSRSMLLQALYAIS